MVEGEVKSTKKTKRKKVKKDFAYNDPHERAFIGRVYSVGRAHRGNERLIYVQHPKGAGIAYRVRYVTRAKATRVTKTTR
jgi:hypothetical protein